MKKIMRLLAVFISLFLFISPASATEWMRLYRTSSGDVWYVDFDSISSTQDRYFVWAKLLFGPKLQAVMSENTGYKVVSLDGYYEFKKSSPTFRAHTIVTNYANGTRSVLNKKIKNWHPAVMMSGQRAIWKALKQSIK